MITSSELHSLFKKNDRDDYVFELVDRPGLQIVRKYPESFSKLVDKRMFINFTLINEGKVWYVGGGVDIVKNRINSESGWVVEISQKSLFQKPTSYNFWKPEDIIFDSQTKSILFKNKTYNIGEFIDLLEKNHLRDMFLLSRLRNYFKLFFLHIIFFCSDSRFRKFDHVYIRQERSLLLKERGVGAASEKADPLFHYFYIYKNLFGVTLLFLLPILFLLSACLSPLYFTVSNPFLLFAALFIFFILEKVSDLLFYLLTKTKFVQRMTRSIFESKGNLRAY